MLRLRSYVIHDHKATGLEPRCGPGHDSAQGQCFPCPKGGCGGPRTRGRELQLKEEMEIKGLAAWLRGAPGSVDLEWRERDEVQRATWG